jgi:hypothetical protein
MKRKIPLIKSWRASVESCFKAIQFFHIFRKCLKK